MEAVSSSIGSGGNLTLHGQALGLPFREAFSQAARAPAAGPKDRDRAIGVDAVRATAVRDECPLPGELLETLLEVVDGHRQRARDVPGGVLPRRTRVQDDDVAGPAAAEQLLFSPCLRLSTRHAARSAFRCWDTLATERVVSWARESTVRSPWARSSRISRRRGLLSALPSRANCA